MSSLMKLQYENGNVQHIHLNFPIIKSITIYENKYTFFTKFDNYNDLTNSLQSNTIYVIAKSYGTFNFTKNEILNIVIEMLSSNLDIYDLSDDKYSSSYICHKNSIHLYNNIHTFNVINPLINYIEDNEYYYLQGVDASGNDIISKNIPISFLKILTDSYNALCFNTFGYVKSKIDQLSNYPKNHGLYIKNIIIKFINQSLNRFYSI